LRRKNCYDSVLKVFYALCGVAAHARQIEKSRHGGRAVFCIIRPVRVQFSIEAANRIENLLKGGLFFMKTLIGGAIAAVLGLIGISIWWKPFLMLLAGALPIMLLMGGGLALYLGFDELKDSWKSDAKTDDAAGTDGPDNYKKEIDSLKQEIETLKGEKA
jgi:hypothetical protein